MERNELKANQRNFGGGTRNRGVEVTPAAYVRWHF
jgi:hypothetical protein